MAEEGQFSLTFCGDLALLDTASRLPQLWRRMRRRVVIKYVSKADVAALAVHARQQDLTPGNHAAIRAKMQTLIGDQGRPLGIRPNVLVVPPQLEEAAFHLLNTERLDGGGSNPWKGTAGIVVTPDLVG